MRRAGAEAAAKSSPSVHDAFRVVPCATRDHRSFLVRIFINGVVFGSESGKCREARLAWVTVTLGPRLLMESNAL